MMGAAEELLGCDRHCWSCKGREPMLQVASAAATCGVIVCYKGSGGGCYMVAGLCYMSRLLRMRLLH
jgi:hypothetical protein